MLEDALGAEHFLVVHAVKLYFLGWVLLAELDGARVEFCRAGIVILRSGRGRHGQPGEHLVVHG